MTSTLARPLQQHPYFADALRRLGYPARLQRLDTAAPIVTLRRFAVTFASRGPIWPDETPLEDKVQTLRHSTLRLVNADRDDPDLYRQAGFRMVSTAASVAELDILQAPAARLAQARPKWRYAYRRAATAKLSIRHHPFDLDRHAWLLEADLAQQAAKKFRALPHTVLTAYAQRSPNDVMVFVAQDGQAPVAAMLFLLHRPVATYYLGWNSPTGRKLNAHHRLLSEAADWLHRKRFQRLDLGTVDTDTAPGLARFKIGTGATIRPLGGTWLRLPGL